MLERNGELTDARRALLRDMERYAASVGCRHRHLVGYFGETLTKDDCGACDYCLGELETVADAGRRWRARSCRAWRASASASAPRTSPTCCAAATASRSRSRGHHELSTFGLLKDASIDEVRGYIEQLLAHGLLRQTDDEYPGAGADRRRAWRC